MARFPQQFIDQVTQATDIVDLIGQYVTLKKKGKEFVGLCPFHNDKNPSMSVSPAKQIFMCFACNTGGGVLKFVELYEKITFPEAVRALAERAHIPLPADMDQAPEQPSGLGKSDLVKAVATAAELFQKALKTASGADALAYAKQRGLSDESIDRFGLGYAPDSWDTLLRSLRTKGFSENQLVAAGLLIRNDRDRCYDRFRNRLIFPILDPAGQPIAFGGRALAADEQAKYLNSPESILFDKSSNLYGLSWARETMNHSARAVVVEGYLDALMPHQMGVANVVATLGTALTERHVRLLSRYVSEVVLVFDADTAGAAAAERALETFIAQQVSVRVATIPAGKDPCDYCLAEGPEAFSALIDAAPDALEYVWQRREADLAEAGGNLADRRRLVDDFLRLVAQSEVYGAIDEIRRGQLAQHIGHMLNISPADLQQQMQRLTRQIRRPETHVAPERAAGPCGAMAPDLRAQHHVLEALLNDADLFDDAAERIGPDDFTDPDLAAIAREFWAAATEGIVVSEQVLSRPALAENTSLVTSLIATGDARGHLKETLRGAVDYLVARRSEAEMDRIKAAGLTDDALREVQRRHHAKPTRFPKIT